MAIAVCLALGQGVPRIGLVEVIAMVNEKPYGVRRFRRDAC
jgi:hypothetical protein